jgi:hypothetical protein
MRELLVNTIPASKCIFSASFKGKQSKAWAIQKDNQWPQMPLWWVCDAQYRCFTKTISFRLGQSLKDIHICGGTGQDSTHILTKKTCPQTHSWLITSKKSAKVITMYVLPACLSFLIDRSQRKTVPVLGALSRSLDFTHHQYIKPNIHTPS